MSTSTLSTILTGSSGLKVQSGPIVQDTTKQLAGRFTLSSNWSPGSGWNYLPSTIQVVNEVPPSINAVAQTTNSTTQITYNTSNGLLYYPVAGRVKINVWIASAQAASSSAGFELRICTYASPAWAAANQVAKTYGASFSNVSDFANNAASILAQQCLITAGSESGIHWDGLVQGGTQIAILLLNSSGLTYNASRLTFTTDYASFTSP